MGTRGRATAALVLLMAASCASQDPEGRKDAPVVHDLTIRGTHVLSEGQIESKILTAETGWWPFAGKKYYDAVEWQTDLKRIVRLYETRGYFQARIVKAESKTRKGNQVDLAIEIDEGKPVLVADIEIEGLDTLTPQERTGVTQKLPLIKGSPFREDAWDNTKRLIARRLRELGRAGTVLDAYAVVDASTYQATLHLAVDTGPLYRFGDVEVKGLDDEGVDPVWVQEQVRLAITPGKLYSDSALEEAQKRVFAMNIFSTARVEVGTLAQGRAPVVADVRVGPFRTLRLGGGIGFDQVRQEGHLKTDWTNRNFLGGLRRLIASAMIGWAYLPSYLSVLRKADEAHDGFIYQAQLDFDQPRLLGRPSLKGKVLLESERTLEETYDALGGRTLVGFNWQPHSSLSIFPSYDLQGYELHGSHDAGAVAAPLTLGCKTDPCFILLSYLQEVITWDRRDSPLEARHGHYFSITLQQGGGPLGGDFTYLSIMPELRGYVSAGENDHYTFAGRLRLGSLLTQSGRPEDSAVTTRFYSGGPQWMRGFAPRRLSPLLLQPVPNADPKLPPDYLALPIGGNGLFEGSLEARSRMTQSLTLALFLDFGSVTRDRLPFGGLPHLLYALGFGIRYNTPVGPLRLDIGVRLPLGEPPPLYDTSGVEITYARDPANPNGTMPGHETGAHVNRSCFGIGGSNASTWVTDGLCAFNLSIGEAF